MNRASKWTPWIGTTMSYPRLPQEITDYIIDILQDEQKTLERCCLISKSWVPRAQQHLFATIRFESPTDLTAWMRTFPDPANSLGYLTRSLYVACVGHVAAVVVGSCDWSRPFSNVVQLEIRSGMRNSIFHPFLPHEVSNFPRR